MKEKKIIFGLITLICLVLVLYVQHVLRIKYTWWILNVLPSYFMCLGLYFLVKMSTKDKKYAIVITLSMGLFLEFQSYFIDKIPVDVFDVITMFLAVLSAELLNRYLFVNHNP